MLVQKVTSDVAFAVQGSAGLLLPWGPRFWGRPTPLPERQAQMLSAISLVLSAGLRSAATGYEAGRRKPHPWKMPRGVPFPKAEQNNESPRRREDVKCCE